MVVLCKVSRQGFHIVCLVSSIMTQAVISFKRACAQFACPQLIGCYSRLISPFLSVLSNLKADGQLSGCLKVRVRSGYEADLTST